VIINGLTGYEMSGYDLI